MNVSQQRIPALDNLRAFLAILGIPFHVVLFLSWYLHFQQASLVQLMQGLSNQVASFVIGVFYIHVFRMPAFFLLAGFFAHMLYQQRGEKNFIANRVVKIAIPFLFSLSWALIIYFSFMAIAALFPAVFPVGLYNIVNAFYHASGDYWGIINNLRSTWFLYDLLWFYGLTLLVLRLNYYFPFVNQSILSLESSCRYFLTQPWCRVVLALLSTILLCQQENLGFTPYENGLIPEVSLLSYYGVWYLLGWFLWRHQDEFALFFKRSGSRLFFSIVLYGIFLIWYFHYPANANFFQRNIGVFLYQLSASFAVFALLGLAWHAVKKPNKIFRYISSAAYWTYLTQVPVIIVLLNCIYHRGDNFFLASLKISSISFVVILLSYQFFVRHTWLNRFFGGKFNG